MRFSIYATETNLGSLITNVRFRVHETVGQMERIKDDCSVTLEGRYEFEDEALLEIVESIYREEMGL
jgi:hypothetical protein